MAAKVQGGSRSDIFYVAPEDLTLITDVKHHLYDERVHLPVLESLVLSIMKHGVKTPIHITSSKEGNSIVINGRQRVKAALEANKRITEAKGDVLVKVPCKVEKGTESDLYAVSILTNEHAQVDGPLTKAKKAKQLIDMGHSEEAASVHFGVTTAAIRQWLKLLELSAPVRKAVDDGKLTASAASKLHGLPAEEQKTALNGAIAESEKTGKKVSASKVVKFTDDGPKNKRPSIKILEKIHKANLIEHSHAANLLAWIIGEIDETDAVDRVPGLHEAIVAKEKK